MPLRSACGFDRTGLYPLSKCRVVDTDDDQLVVGEKATFDGLPERQAVEHRHKLGFLVHRRDFAVGFPAALMTHPHGPLPKLLRVLADTSHNLPVLDCHDLPDPTEAHARLAAARADSPIGVGHGQRPGGFSRLAALGRCPELRVRDSSHGTAAAVRLMEHCVHHARHQLPSLPEVRDSPDIAAPAGVEAAQLAWTGCLD
jgi:hypothetical protein